MARFSDQPNDAYHVPAEEDLSRLIRWTVKDSVSEAEPPADAWPKILARVRELNAPTMPRRRPKRALIHLSALVQAAVIGALLLAFGLGVDRSVSTPRGDQRIYPTPTVKKETASQEFPEDVLRGYMLARKVRALPAHKGGLLP